MLDFFARIFSFDPNSPLLFTQFYFWAFFAIVYAIFSLIHSKRLLRNTFLFFVSAFFYYKTSGLALLILLFVTLSDFLIAKRIYKNRYLSESKNKEHWAKFWLILSVTIDLSLLAFFKYSYFFINMLNDMFGTSLHVFNVFSLIGNTIAGEPVFSVDRIVLPVGISFYIFQIISYTVDVYRGEIKPVSNIFDFGFYVSFFPQLVAGPIVKASDFIPQLYRPFFITRRQFGFAVFWILNGLTKKIILSDYIAVNFIDRVFENPLLFNGFENLAALFGYSLQVYADFSGYTDIAIGVAMLMGFFLPKNFNSPYKSQSAHEFWKRWHISLSRWLQNYLYIPLGGNRNTSFGTYFWIITIALIALILTGSLWALGAILTVAIAVLLSAWLLPERRKKLYANLNSFITMLLGGLWHGASWNFMIWGGLNGIGMIVYKLWKDMNWHLRMILCLTITCGLLTVQHYYPLPVWNMLSVWMLIITAGTIIRYAYYLLINKDNMLTNATAQAWAVMQTFVFITFTRLFFRSGSNLDPATANQEAWNTAKNMVNQIGSQWNMEVIPDICHAYWKVFLLIILGMIIHWLPDRFKRRYRYCFAVMPLPLMIIAVVAVVFIVYQFITADLQAFIYFQF